MKKVNMYAADGMIVIWCETCRTTLARLAGMHPADFVMSLTQAECKCGDSRES